jgi:(S)-2-hydroxy-acid oxidase
MAHPDGELATSRACAKLGVPMGVSSFATYTVGDIRAAAAEVTAGKGDGIDHAMQLYTMKAKALQSRIIHRAETAGCKAIFLTGDSPVLGVRYNEWQNGFQTPEGLGYPNMEMNSKNIRDASHDDKFATINDDGHEWDRDIKALREQTGMEIWIKGVLCAEDVEKAIEAGCDGVIVSSSLTFVLRLF